MTTRRFAATVCVSAAAGAAAALLFAPMSGRRLRRHLRASVDRLSLRARDLYETAADSVHDLALEGRKAIGR